MSNGDLPGAEAACAKLEAELLAAKEAGELDDDLRLRLRAARQHAREIRQATGVELGPGDAIADPDVIQARAGVNN